MNPNECMRTIVVDRQKERIRCPHFSECKQIFWAGNRTAGHCEQYEPVVCKECGRELKDKDTFPICNVCDEKAVDGLIESYLEDALSGG